MDLVEYIELILNEKKSSIRSRRQASNILASVAKHGTSKRKTEVRKAVCDKYPDLPYCIKKRKKRKEEKIEAKYRKAKEKREKEQKKKERKQKEKKEKEKRKEKKERKERKEREKKEKE